MKIHHFYDNNTATFTYVVVDEKTNLCAIIDPVLDFDLHSGRINTYLVKKIMSFIQDNQLTVEWILETHVHADHLTGSYYLKQALGGKTGISRRITAVLDFWVPKFGTAHDTPLDGSQFDYLFDDDETFAIGNLSVKVLATPGHTPACSSYLVEDAIFAGDSLFMPALGTARADFPGGSAKTLYQSIRKILSLPPETQIYIGHDYPEQGKEAECLSTVAEQNRNNVMINENVLEESYIAMRNARDSQLAIPKLLLPSLQVNLRAGHLGKPEENGVRYLKLPVNQL